MQRPARRLGLLERHRQLAPVALGGEVVSLWAKSTTALGGLGVDAEAKPGGKARRTQRTKGIFVKCVAHVA